MILNEIKEFIKICPAEKLEETLQINDFSKNLISFLVINKIISTKDLKKIIDEMPPRLIKTFVRISIFLPLIKLDVTSHKKKTTRAENFLIHVLNKVPAEDKLPILMDYFTVSKLNLSSDSTIEDFIKEKQNEEGFMQASLKYPNISYAIFKNNPKSFNEFLAERGGFENLTEEEKVHLGWYNLSWLKEKALNMSLRDREKLVDKKNYYSSKETNEPVSLGKDIRITVDQINFSGNSALLMKITSFLLDYYTPLDFACLALLKEYRESILTLLPNFSDLQKNIILPFLLEENEGKISQEFFMQLFPHLTEELKTTFFASYLDTLKLTEIQDGLKKLASLEGIERDALLIDLKLSAKLLKKSFNDEKLKKLLSEDSNSSFATNYQNCEKDVENLESELNSLEILTNYEPEKPWLDPISMTLMENPLQLPGKDTSNTIIYTENYIDANFYNRADPAWVRIVNGIKEYRNPLNNLWFAATAFKPAVQLKADIDFWKNAHPNWDKYFELMIS